MQEHGSGSSLTPSEASDAAGSATSHRHTALAVVVAVAVIVLDQLTKWWATNALADRDIDLFWTFRLHLERNTGAAFSVAGGRGGLVALLALGVVVVFLVMGRGVQGRLGAVAVGLVIGGAISNLLDRVFREGSGFLGGGVVDFVDPQWWPIFNVADSSVVIGALLLVIVVGRADA